MESRCAKAVGGTRVLAASCSRRPQQDVGYQVDGFLFGLKCRVSRAVPVFIKLSLNSGANNLLQNSDWPWLTPESRTCPFQMRFKILEHREALRTNESWKTREKP